MTTKLSGKVALITGASAGIGQACARALTEEGARLVLTARRQERLDELKQQAEKLGTQAITVLGDAREESTAKNTVEAAMQTFGQIDILINNTGVGNYKNLVDTSAEEYDDMMDTNVRSTFLFTRHTVPVMLDARHGRNHQDGALLLLNASAKGRCIRGRPNTTAVLHTWGQNLDFHPHLHCIVTGGALSSMNQVL